MERQYGSVGVVVLKDGKFLTGTRLSKTGYLQICGPGGHIEEGESPATAAMRETEEEFGIILNDLHFLGVGPKEADTGLSPVIFLSTSFTGKPKTDNMEMVSPRFLSLGDLSYEMLFPPFANGVNALLKAVLDISEKPVNPLYKDGIDGIINMGVIPDYKAVIPQQEQSSKKDGGPGSGNFGHAGRPGKRGGSAPDNSGSSAGSSSNTSEKKEKPKAQTQPKASQTSSGKTTSAKVKSAPGHVVSGKNGNFKPKSQKAKKISTADAVADHQKGHKNSLSDHVDEHGELSAERQAVHDEIIRKDFEGKVSHKGRATMIMSGGGPASGKSFIRKSAEAQFGAETVKTVDPDDYKKALPGYSDMARETETAAGFYHEESSALAKRAYQYAVDNNVNVVYDGTGDGSVGSVLSKIKTARDAGYEVRGSYVTVDVEEALKRNQKRYEDAKALFDAGKSDIPPRLPHPDEVRRSHAAVSDISIRTAHEFDSWELYDNNGPFGSKPVKIATCKRGGKITAVKGKEKMLQKYLDKGSSGAKVINGVVVIPEE